MVGGRLNGYAKDLQALFAAGALGDLGDAQLLERFLEHERDGPAAEAAFAALVERHAPMVLRVCIGVLGDFHDAQDVVQATFLVLAQRAGSVRRRGSVASWLHGVALRLASKVKRGAARRRFHERRGGEIMTARRDEQAGPPPAGSWPELHEELGRLPGRYREPIVLCHLEGLTQEQAARRLGCPIGTVQSRLARGRDRLRARLLRRGLAPAAAALATASMAPAEAAVSAAWVESTARAAVQIAAGRSIAGSVPAAVLLLWRIGSRSSMMSRLLIACGVMAMIGVLAAGSISLGLAGQDGGDGGAARIDDRRTQDLRKDLWPGEDGKGEEAPSIAGRWEVLYIAGTVRGKREGYVEPNMLVPITERTINLPIFSGNEGPFIVSGAASKDGRTGAGTFIVNKQGPIVYRGKLDYTAERKDQLGVIQVLTQDVGGKRDVWMQGIYRLAGDNLVICYSAERGPVPEAFAADKDTEILLILRRERPQARPARHPDERILFPPKIQKK
jgi:RNA polymerase sigma factor (sigma-70 family)